MGYTFLGLSLIIFIAWLAFFIFIFYFYGFYFLITRSYGLSSRQKGNVSAEHVKDCMGLRHSNSIGYLVLPPMAGVQGKITIFTYIYNFNIFRPLIIAIFI